MGFYVKKCAIDMNLGLEISESLLKLLKCPINHVLYVCVTVCACLCLFLKEFYLFFNNRKSNTK